MMVSRNPISYIASQIFKNKIHNFTLPLTWQAHTSLCVCHRTLLAGSRCNGVSRSTNSLLFHFWSKYKYQERDNNAGM
jgi:hypothetical protein